LAFGGSRDRLEMATIYWQGSALTDEELFRSVSLAAGKFAHVPVGPARFGLRHASLNALALGRYKRALALAEAATRFPLEVVVNLVPVGRVVGPAEIDALYAQALEVFSAVPHLPRPCPHAMRCREVRPWRALFTVIQALPYPDEERGNLLRWTALLGEPGAWVGHTYLKLASRHDLPVEDLAHGVAVLVMGWKRFIETHRARWFPELYPEERGKD